MWAQKRGPSGEVALRTRANHGQGTGNLPESGDSRVECINFQGAKMTIVGRSNSIVVVISSNEKLGLASKTRCLAILQPH